MYLKIYLFIFSLLIIAVLQFISVIKKSHKKGGNLSTWPNCEKIKTLKSQCSLKAREIFLEGKSVFRISW